ncbi:MAG TPA: trypsin-like peptidase domain-containing protein [Solirubrobacteraceae bacterium]|nr:trypsin-like peptidase domain-containing protein [Solirubrobacteraceae bacterium]
MTRTVTTSSAAGATSEPAAFSSGGGMTINQIYKKAGPGVVDIVVTTSGSSNSLFGGGSAQKDEGAGVVYNDKGYILTDQHVVAGAKSIRVTFQDGRVASAKLIGTDPSTDVGVIKVNVPQSELHPLQFADSSTAQVGDAVVAIGSPFSLPETVTSGIVSQTGRSIQAPNSYTIPGAIQTDAAINPGNSGGPLLNADGEVLGLNDQIDTNNTTVGGEGSNSGIGFATPGNEVQKVADTIIAGKPVKHSYVGVFLSSTSEGGARVATQEENGQPPIAPGSPAARAGLEPGDLITAVDGTKITSTNQFIATVFQDDPGQTITLTVTRDGQTKHIQVTLGTRPAKAPGG